MYFDPTNDPGGWRCELRAAWHEMRTLQFFKKVLYCSWAHRRYWTTLNNGKRRLVGARCFPHVWHECDTWHCTLCRPCDEGIATLLKSQKPMPPEFAKVINDNFWDLL